MELFAKCPEGDVSARIVAGSPLGEKAREAFS